MPTNQLQGHELHCLTFFLLRYPLLGKQGLSSSSAAAAAASCFCKVLTSLEQPSMHYLLYHKQKLQHIEFSMSNN
jgi:hypothetical protein